MWYILNEKNEPVPEPDCLVAAQFLESGNRIVAQSDVGDAHLSTVFLCLDHGMGRPGGPVLYESMWFGGPMDGDQRRYRTREEALEGVLCNLFTLTLEEYKCEESSKSS